MTTRRALGWMIATLVVGIVAVDAGVASADPAAGTARCDHPAIAYLPAAHRIVMACANAESESARCASYALDAHRGLVASTRAAFGGPARELASYAIASGTAALVIYGSGDATYATVLGPSCQTLAAPARVGTAESALYDGGFALDNPDGSTDALFGVVGASGGRLAKAHVARTPDGGFTIGTMFEQLVVENGARGRGTIVRTGDPSHALAVYADGALGIRASYVDISETAPVNTDVDSAVGGRIEWRQYLMQRQGSVSFTSPSLTALATARDGAIDYVARWMMVDPGDFHGRQDGRAGLKEVQSARIRVTASGVTMLDRHVEAGLVSDTPNAIVVDNPGFGVAGGYRSTVRSFAVVPRASLVLAPVDGEHVVPQPAADGSDGPTMTLSGCDAAGNAGGFAVLALIALVLVSRRRF